MTPPTDSSNGVINNNATSSIAGDGCTKIPLQSDHGINVTLEFSRQKNVASFILHSTRSLTVYICVMQYCSQVICDRALTSCLLDEHRHLSPFSALIPI